MMDTKSPQDWLKDYQALQGQYWSAWSDLTKQNAPAPVTGMPWQQGVDQWSRMFADAGKQSETAERMMGSAKNYLGLMQAMMAAASAQSSGSGGPQVWLDGLRNSFNMPGVDPAMMNNPIAKAMRDMVGPGAKGFEQFSEGFAPFLKNLQQESTSWLHTPTFGHDREQQEHLKKMAAAMLDVQQATQKYNALIMQSSQRGFEIFEGKLAERSEPGRQLDSIKAVYDLWVDAAEEAYAAVALSDEFRKVYAEVVNAQMRLRAQIQHQVERIGADLGMPTRTELNSVHKRMQELKRELRASKSSTRSDDVNDEVVQLRGEVQALKRSLASAQSSGMTSPALAKHAAVKPAPAKRASTKPAKVKPTSLKSVAAKPAAVEAATPIPVGDSRSAPVAAAQVRRRHSTKRSSASRPRIRTTSMPAGAKPDAAVKPQKGAFGDAINAMRRKVAKQGKKKAARAELVKPVKSSRTFAPNKRSRSPRSGAK